MCIGHRSKKILHKKSRISLLPLQEAQLHDDIRHWTFVSRGTIRRFGTPAIVVGLRRGRKGWCRGWILKEVRKESELSYVVYKLHMCIEIIEIKICILNIYIYIVYVNIVHSLQLGDNIFNPSYHSNFDKPAANQ